jgi:hypothetical protein
MTLGEIEVFDSVKERWQKNTMMSRIGSDVVRQPHLCSFLPQRLQRATPGDDLVEQGVDRLLLLGSRLEDAEVLEIGEEGKTDLLFFTRFEAAFRRDRIRVTSYTNTIYRKNAPIKGCRGGLIWSGRNRL